MWTVEKLRAIAAARGEMESDATVVGVVLLAHERARGRTEEDYPRDKARKELDAALDGLAGSLPQARAQEYPGLKQLRAYAADRMLARPATKVNEVAKSAEPVAPVRAGLMGALQRGREQERDRG